MALAAVPMVTQRVVRAETKDEFPASVAMADASAGAVFLADALPMVYEAPLLPFGRVVVPELEIFAAPQRDAAILRRVSFDDLLPLRARVTGDAVQPHNDKWFALEDGYVYSSLVQPVQDMHNDPQPGFAKQGFWGDVTAPFIDARVAAASDARVAKRLYFGSVYRVIDASVDADGAWWYRLHYGVSRGPGPWVPAENVRRFDPAADLSPLSPDVKDKRIEVDLPTQIMTAYENGRAVLRVMVSTGTGRLFTPIGNYRVFRKAPGQRLVGGWGSGYYDLPGVPFVTYFTYNGVAIHGAYWHNDFGTMRSHGCVNVPVDVARWFWRWTTPAAPQEASDIWFRPAQGTPVRVA